MGTIRYLIRYGSAVVVALCSSVLWAQPNGDVHLQLDPVVGLVEPPARIESAAEVGGTVAIAWGNTVRNEFDSVVNVIEVAVVDSTGHTTILGVPHQPSAVLGQFVTVVPLPTGFVVVWTEVGASRFGFYGRYVTLQGTMPRPEFRIAANDTAVASAGWVGVDGVSILLLEIRPGGRELHATRLDSLGNVLEFDRRIASTTGVAQQQVATMPGATILNLTNGTSLFAHADGRIDDRPLPPSLGSVPHYFGADSSLTTLSGDTLRTYASMFSEGDRHFRVDTSLDSLSQLSMILARRSDGTFAVYGTTGYASNSEHVGLRLIEAVYDSTLTRRSWSDVDTFPLDSSPDILILNRTVGSPKRAFGCDNTAAVNIHISEFQSTYIQDKYVDYDFNYSVGADGSFRPRVYEVEACSARGYVVARRTRWDALSAVDAYTSRGTVSVADSSAVQEFNTIQRNPGIRNFGADLRVTYITNDPEVSGSNVDRLMVATVGRNGTARSSPGVNGFVSNIGDYPCVKELPPNYFDGIITFGSPWTVLNRPGKTFVFEGAGYRAYYRDIRRLVPWSICSAQYAVTAVSGTVFRRVAMDHRCGLSDPPLAWAESARVDPDDGRMNLMVGTNGEWASRRVLQFAPNDTLENTWIDVLPDRLGSSLQIVPIAPADCLLVDDTVAIRMKEGTYVDTLRFAEHAEVSLPLKSDRMLRITDADSVLRLAVYGADGARRFRRDVLRIAAPNSCLVRQDTASGTIAIIAGGNGGVRGIILGSDLSGYGGILQLSQTRDSVGSVAATFSGDSLLVVWEDFRNGIANLYLASNPNALRTSRDTVPNVQPDDNPPHDIGPPRDPPRDPPLSGPIVVDVWPNPASERLQVHCLVTYRDPVRMWFTDEIGREVGIRTWLEPGETTEVDVSGLRPGLYWIHTGGGQTVDRALPVVVVR